MAIDWTRGDLRHGLTVLQVDPTDLTDVRGELRGVTGGKLDLQYYGDTRMGAKLETAGLHGWDGSAALRLVHTVSDHTGMLLVEPLFTGFVTEASWEGEGDARKVSWTLNSTLHAMESAVSGWPYGVAAGSKALDVIAQVCASLDRPCRIDQSAHEYLFSSNKVYEAGSTYASILFDVCDRSENRMSVDAEGVVTFSAYELPASRGVDYDASELGERGTVIGPVSGDAMGLDAPARVVVRAEDGDKSVTGEALAPDGSPSSARVRGFRNDRFEKVSDLSPFEAEAARALAKRYLDADLSEVPSISHKMMYRPLREGDVERLTMADGSVARWMVSGASLDLATWTWDLDLKGGWAA
jgi:hypothetical protein